LRLRAKKLVTRANLFTRNLLGVQPVVQDLPIRVTFVGTKRANPRKFGRKRSLLQPAP